MQSRYSDNLKDNKRGSERDREIPVVSICFGFTNNFIPFIAIVQLVC